MDYFKVYTFKEKKILFVIHLYLLFFFWTKYRSRGFVYCLSLMVKLNTISCYNYSISYWILPSEKYIVKSIYYTTTSAIETSPLWYRIMSSIYRKCSNAIHYGNAETIGRVILYYVCYTESIVVLVPCDQFVNKLPILEIITRRRDQFYTTKTIILYE